MSPAIAVSPASAPGRSVGWHLSMFAVALALPILVFVGFLLLQYASVERDRLEREASTLARSTAQSIDRELSGLSAALDVLSLSANLQSGDLAAFYEQAKALEARQGVDTVLRDTTGQMLLNTRVPYGTPLPATRLPTDRLVLDTGKLQVSGVFVGPVAKRPLFAVIAPVTVDGQIRYLLNLSLDSERVNSIVLQEEPPASTIVAVVDGTGKILARSVRAAEFVGQAASPDFLKAAKGRQGSWKGTTVDGYEVVGAYARTNLADWWVAVGVQDSDLNAPIWKSLGLFALLGLVLAALSTAFALLFARRIAGPLRALAERATEAGKGLVVAPLEGPLLEANEVSAQLSDASNRLVQRETDLRESNEEIQRFAYIVSHDLRAPLVNIMGFTSELESIRGDLVEPRPDIDDAARAEIAASFDESLGFIKAAIAKMDSLIGAILKISREGRRAFRMEGVEMTTLVQGLADAIRFQAEAAGATIEIKQLPTITSDRLALQQIFGNLLDNAVKYLDPSRPGRISITSSEVEGRISFVISDNGRGIAEKDLDRVFELFRRAGTQDRPGEGIGLAHVRTLVRAVGGRIDVSSRLGVGTTFTVILPRTTRILIDQS